MSTASGDGLIVITFAFRVTCWALWVVVVALSAGAGGAMGAKARTLDPTIARPVVMYGRSAECMCRPFQVVAM